jgi:hypothetical protein
VSYVQELLNLSPWIRVVAKPFADDVENMHWISTPKGDEGNEWCYGCGSAKVEELRTADPEHADDYFLDGWWAIEDDSSCWCEGCGARLNSIMTDYCAASELDHYVTYGVTPFCAEIAYDLSELIDHFDYQTEKSDPRNIADCIHLARSFLAGYYHQEIVQPSQWADDGGRA